MTTTISATGLSFTSRVSMPVHTHLQMNLSAPRVSEDIALEGQIVWVDGEDGAGEYEYGLRFDPPPEEETLVHFIRSTDVVPLLEIMEERHASELYLTPNDPPMLRVQHRLEPALGHALPPYKVEAIINGIMSTERRKQLRQNRQVEFGFSVPEMGRWRVNVHYQRGDLAATFRVASQAPQSIEELDLPPVVADLIASRQGLILVTGPAGSGKSTSLAAFINILNRDSSLVIHTVEDPIEFVHESNQSLVKQQEVGADVQNMASGLRNALCQRAEVVVASDLCDREAMDLALRAAESGSLVLGALPTADPFNVLERIVSMYPREERDSILYLLSAALRGIVSQRLLPARTESGVRLVVEVFTLNEDIRQAIRLDRFDQLPTLAQSGPGAQSLDVSLQHAILNGHINAEEGISLARNPEQLRSLLSEHR